jgi:hypothetical protein
MSTLPNFHEPSPQKATFSEVDDAVSLSQTSESDKNNLPFSARTMQQTSRIDVVTH